MSTRPSESPASEHSVYFDAPLMHIFTRKNRDSLSADGDGVDDSTNAGAADADRQPSVFIPRDPVANERPDGRAVSPQADDVPLSDSGYDSPDLPRAPSRASQKSIPVLWHGSGSPDTQAPWRRAREDGQDERAVRRAASLRSTDRASVRTTPSVRRRRSFGGGSFASGAGTVGPAASAGPDEGFRQRGADADAALSEKQRSRLQKAQVKEGKQVVKVLKGEARAEQEALKGAIRELGDIQKMQKTAIKDEAKAYATHAKALRTFHKEELEFFAARARYERAQAELQAHEDARESTRNHSKEITEMLQDKNREVEWLRAQKGADDREREVKMRQLTG